MASDDKPGAHPEWPEIKRHALGCLEAALNEIDEAAGSLRSIGSPMTPAEVRSTADALNLLAKAKSMVGAAKGALGG